MANTHRRHGRKIRRINRNAYHRKRTDGKRKTCAYIAIKIIYRVIGFDTFRDSKIINVLFVFGLAGMIMGSLSAIRENDIRRMISFVTKSGVWYVPFATIASMPALILLIKRCPVKS